MVGYEVHVVVPGLVIFMWSPGERGMDATPSIVSPPVDVRVTVPPDMLLIMYALPEFAAHDGRLTIPGVRILIIAFPEDMEYGALTFTTEYVMLPTWTPLPDIWNTGVVGSDPKY